MGSATGRRWGGGRLAAALPIVLGAIVAIVTTTSVATEAHATTSRLRNFTAVYKGVPARGELDCNGDSPAQKALRDFNCTDIRGFAGAGNANMWDGRFYDNGVYIGHDEPDTTFLSSKPGSGGNVSWNLTLGTDPSAAPTGTAPGHDVSHWFELTPAPWLSMAMCDGNSYPLTPCAPNSDANAPSGAYIGGGSAFMEMQFYPPGNAPWVDSESCDNAHWCAAITIDSLECTLGFAQCNTNCEEPVNFAFIQTNGKPAGPPSPQLSDLASSVPNAETLLMNPGDQVAVHMFDARVPGGGGAKAFKVVIDDLTTGKSGFMQASAKNGFKNTSIVDCSGTPFNFEPEYSTASVGNYVPWAALQTNISTEFETGHFEPCTSLSSPFQQNPIDPQDTGGTYAACAGPYESAGGSEGPEVSDANCYAKGDVHKGYDGGSSTTPPNEVTGCQDNWFQNGDLDFDGTPYWTEWPTGMKSTHTLPGSFVEALPVTDGTGYKRFFFQTDLDLSEASCLPSGGCTVPPSGPGHFYPYWSEANKGGACTLEFGNVSANVDTFGKDAQYGTPQWSTLGYPEVMGSILDNTCPSAQSEGYLLVGSGGEVTAAGDAPALPSVHAPAAPVVSIVATASGKGYFAVTDTGVVSAVGDAAFHGDLTTLSTPIKVSDIVAIAPTADGNGYWLIGADGGEFAFGDAKFHGSLPGKGIHAHDVIGMVANPSGAGYLIVGGDGGVFAFGAARFFGSLPGLGKRVNDIRGILPSPAGTGYILVGRDGGAFVFGRGVPFHGSLPGKHIKVSDVVGIALTTDGGGYWMAGSNGAVYPFGDARKLSITLKPSEMPISAITGVNTTSPA
jgi:hypothetical protein